MSKAANLSRFRAKDCQENQWTPSAEAIADALGGKKAGAGRWMARCPSHDDRSPSLSIKDADGLVLVHCFGGCPQEDVLESLRSMRLWPDKAQPVQLRRGPSIAELERESWRHALAGTYPDRLPPFTRELPRSGIVTILCAGADWPRRPVPALVLPPGHPPGAYRWPVAGRHVELIDLATNPPPGYFHYGRLPWLADPWQWVDVRRRWLRGFSALLLRQAAVSVRVVGMTRESVLYEAKGVRHAA